MDEQKNQEQIHETFLKSRDGAIMRCVGIMIDLKRKDLAKQILETTHIDRKRFEEIKAQNL